MNFENIDCIDSGTEFCPCKLAEQNECILCSQLRGRHFCDCINWKGTCIYQEFYNNGSKAKEGRKTIDCTINSIEQKEEHLIALSVAVPHKLAIDLSAPGSYVFLRTDDNIYMDFPISVAYSDTDSNIISLFVEIRGVKTKKLLSLTSGETIGIRGPYWNGVFGLKNIDTCKDSNCIIIARGIGQAPMIPVIKKLIANNNTIRLIIDKAPFNDIYIDEYLKYLGMTYEKLSVIDKGELTDDIKQLIIEEKKAKGISLIHSAGADILTYKIIEFLDTVDKDIKLSCCNNAKMCCGEGMCGSCTARFKGHKVKRLCKIQTDPRNIFEGRRFI